MFEIKGAPCTRCAHFVYCGTRYKADNCMSTSRRYYLTRFVPVITAMKDVRANGISFSINVMSSPYTIIMFNDIYFSLHLICFRDSFEW